MAPLKQPLPGALPKALPGQRALFDIPDDVAYLNCAYIGPLPKPALAAGEIGMARKATPWIVSQSDFFTESDAIRALLGRMINAPADRLGQDVALVPSVSYGMAQAVSALEPGLRPGQEILVLADQFPSNLYPWMVLAERKGARIKTVPRPADDDWTAAVLEHLTPAVAIAALPHNHWTDGGLLDLESIGRACRAQGAALCVDATQSLGALPFDAARIDPDFLAVGGYKWLLGPYSYGYLYVAPRWQQALPIEQNWITRKASEDFSRLVEYQAEYQPGACRFDVGERSNFALAPAAKASLELLLDWGVENIQASLRARTDQIAARAQDEFGLGSVAPNRRAGHFLGLRFKGAPPADLPARLAQAKVYVSIRGPAMRVTPHLYNTDADVDRLFAVLRDAL